MSYILPDKSLLEENYLEPDNDKYYNLSKLILKKDIGNKLLFPVGLNKIDKYYIDLENKSSMLILGETGSGKSIFLNSIIISLLLKNTPEELKIMFIDTKGMEFKCYEKIPHVFNHIIKSPQEALFELENINKEIELRQNIFLEKGVKRISEYNANNDTKIPHIVVIIDEASDILNDKNIEQTLLTAITDGYRYGIHLIIATNSYLREKLSTFFLRAFDYILTFDLAIHDQADYIKINEADLLTVYGEALIKCNGNNIIELQTPYVSNKDIDSVVNYINNQH